MGQRDKDVIPEDRKIALKVCASPLPGGTARHSKYAKQMWFVCEMFNITAVTVLKISVGFFLLRVATSRWHIWFLRILMASTGLFGTVYLIMITFQCVPIHTYWEEGPRTRGKCWEDKIMLLLTITAQGLNTMADWCFGTLPFFIVRSLSLPMATKIVVACILGFAAIASIATIIRATYIPKVLESEDFLYKTTMFSVWSVVEPGVGIVAACMATLRPLYQLVRYKTGFSPNGPENMQWRNRHCGRPRDETDRLRDLEQGNSVRDGISPWSLLRSFRLSINSGSDNTSPP
ncbi:hypothetical protein QSH57_004534 [Fusarium oxysporum f. sp. vasinfectum]|nr:hypothetical protein QSH57_004534 [Fusarium oxysporum f. sp. vasinfectum]